MIFTSADTSATQMAVCSTNHPMFEPAVSCHVQEPVCRTRARNQLEASKGRTQLARLTNLLRPRHGACQNMSRRIRPSIVLELCTWTGQNHRINYGYKIKDWNLFN